MNFFDMFKDDKTGQLSFSRVSAAFVLGGICIWEGYIAYKTNVLNDIPTGWLSYVLVAYGINKVVSNTTGKTE